MPRIDVADPTSNLEALVDADPDTLAAALYVRTDDLLRSFPAPGAVAPGAGITPGLRACLRIRKRARVTGRPAFPPRPGTPPRALAGKPSDDQLLAQNNLLCVATVAGSTCPRSTPNGGSARVLPNLTITQGNTVRRLSPMPSVGWSPHDWA